LTGGRLPAETFQRIMAYALQGAELKPLVGVENSIPLPQTDSDTEVADEIGAEDDQQLAQMRPRLLSKATSDFLQNLTLKLENTPPLKRDHQNISSTSN